MKVINTLLVFVLTICAYIPNIAFGQDLIIKKNGEEIQCKVLEVLLTDVKFKKTSNLEGPTYSIMKTEIFMIKYENGDKDVFSASEKEKQLSTLDDSSIGLRNENRKFYLDNNEISKSEFLTNLKTNRAAYRKYQDGKALYTTGFVVIIPSSVLFGVSIGRMILGENKNNALLISSGSFLVVGQVLSYLGQRTKDKSLELYNSSRQSAFKFGISGHGFSLTYVIK